MIYSLTGQRLDINHASYSPERRSIKAGLQDIFIYFFLHHAALEICFYNLYFDLFQKVDYRYFYVVVLVIFKRTNVRFYRNELWNVHIKQLF